jgi:hypothetical protein
MRVEPIPCSQATGYSSPTALAFVRSPEQFAEHFPSTAELLSSGSLSGSTLSPPPNVKRLYGQSS